MLGKTRVVVFQSGFFETLGQVHGVGTMLFHADMQRAEVLENAGRAHRVEDGTEEHRRTVVHVDEGVDVLGGTADGTGHAVVLAVHELGHTIDHHIGTQTVG